MLAAPSYTRYHKTVCCMLIIRIDYVDNLPDEVLESNKCQHTIYKWLQYGRILPVSAISYDNYTNKDIKNTLFV